MQTLRVLMTVAVAAVLAGAAIAQEGHPLTGTWYGVYDAGNQKRDITVIMKWDGKAVSGLIDPGPNSKPLTSAALTITPGKPAPEGVDSTQGKPPIFHVRFEVDGMRFEGTIQNPVAGNRRIVGTWSRTKEGRQGLPADGGEKGAFQIRRL